MSRRYRAFNIAYAANSHGETGVQYGSGTPSLVPSNGSVATAANISRSDGVTVMRDTVAVSAPAGRSAMRAADGAADV
ncbi:hypothetical protein JS533_007850 [Bifidobacterium amazonense]|uniref:Uncharacterized protein n=1 Tax=Bifidobacterium amazonense TaxID=2809027 RepID=A0ABS9VVT6_9BIFI|nr:hypothetical protein [Bifidobacterium amazonense]MCH9276182.1 hypothetical protein [Bifidobacterium amazonense]